MVGSGPSESVFDSGGNGAVAAVGGDVVGSVIHGPEPAPPSRTRSILNYLKPSQAPPSSTASAGVAAAALPPPSSLEVQLLAQKAANFAQASNPAMFNLYDQDDKDFYSDTEDDGGLGADVADALAHYQQLEAERLADSAHQVHDHVQVVAQHLHMSEHKVKETNEDIHQREQPVAQYLKS